MTGPANQPYLGRLYPKDLITQNNWRIGGSSPVVVEDMKDMHGRYLAGFGDPSYQEEDRIDEDPENVEYLKNELEYEDDVDGSGIFDSHDRRPTSNASMGVFASHYSLPGYASREVYFQENKDIVDVTAGVPVVGVPGGMNYIERDGQLACGRGGGGQVTGQSILRQPPYSVDENSPYEYTAPTSPEYMGVPRYPNYARIARRDTSEASQMIAPVQQFPNMQPVAQSAPDMPLGPVVPFTNTANTAMQANAVSGFGQTSDSSTTVKIVIFGALLGGATALLLKAMGVKVPYIG